MNQKNYHQAYSTCPFCGSNLESKSCSLFGKEQFVNYPSLSCEKIIKEQNNPHAFEVRFDGLEVKEIEVAFKFSPKDLYSIIFNLEYKNCKVMQYFSSKEILVLEKDKYRTQINWSSQELYETNTLIKFKNIEALKNKLETYLTMC